MDATTRLASYGTLAPGRENAGQLEGLAGTWRTGTVHGHATTNTRGRWAGYPGFVPDPQGPAVTVFIFESPDLPGHWPRLDAFEGAAYERVATMAHTESGPLEVSIYALKIDTDG